MSLLLAIQSINHEGRGVVKSWNKEEKIPMPTGAMTIGNHGDLTNSLYANPCRVLIPQS